MLRSKTFLTFILTISIFSTNFPIPFPSTETLKMIAFDLTKKTAQGTAMVIGIEGARWGFRKLTQTNDPEINKLQATQNRNLIRDDKIRLAAQHYQQIEKLTTLLRGIEDQAARFEAAEKKALATAARLSAQECTQKIAQEIESHGKYLKEL